MKRIEQRGTVGLAGPPLDQFAEVRTYLSALGSHVARGKALDLTCMLIVTQSIVGLAPALGLSETRKRAQTLKIIVRGIVSRNGQATDEELQVLSRAYRRLADTARDEGAGF